MKSSSAGMCAGRSTTAPDSCTSSTGRDDDAFATGGCLGVDALKPLPGHLGISCAFGVFISCVSMETKDPKQGSLHKISTIMNGNLVSSMQGLCNRSLQESFLHIFISYLINVYGNLHNCA